MILADKTIDNKRLLISKGTHPVLFDEDYLWIDREERYCIKFESKDYQSVIDRLLNKGIKLEFLKDYSFDELNMKAKIYMSNNLGYAIVVFKDNMTCVSKTIADEKNKHVIRREDKNIDKNAKSSCKYIFERYLLKLEQLNKDERQIEKEEPIIKSLLISLDVLLKCKKCSAIFRDNIEIACINDNVYATCPECSYKNELESTYDLIKKD